MSNEMLEQQVQAANTAKSNYRNHHGCRHSNRGRDAKEAEDTQQRPAGRIFTDGQIEKQSGTTGNAGFRVPKHE